jgi:hypothetical protein
LWLGSVVVVAVVAAAVATVADAATAAGNAGTAVLLPLSLWIKIARQTPKQQVAPLNRRHIPMWGQPKAKCNTPLWRMSTVVTL